MSYIKLEATSRDIKKKSRAKDKIPAVMYGPNSKNKHLELNYHDLARAYEDAGESSLIDLVVDDKNPVKVLIHDIQKDPLSDKYIHVDFYQLDMNKKLTVEVELVFEGIEEVEKATQAEVIRSLDKLEVECLPKDLVREIKINLVEFLKNIGDVVYAKDIKLPADLTLITEPENALASLQEIKEEIIEEPKEEAVESEEVEGEEAEEKEAEGDKKEAKEGEQTQVKKDEQKQPGPEDKK